MWHSLYSNGRRATLCVKMIVTVLSSYCTRSTIRSACCSSSLSSTIHIPHHSLTNNAEIVKSFGTAVDDWCLHTCLTVYVFLKLLGTWMIHPWVRSSGARYRMPRCQTQIESLESRHNKIYVIYVYHFRHRNIKRVRSSFRLSWREFNRCTRGRPFWTPYWRGCSQSMYNHHIQFLFHASFGHIVFSSPSAWTSDEKEGTSALGVPPQSFPQHLEFPRSSFPTTNKVLFEQQVICLRASDGTGSSSLPMAEDVWKDFEEKRPTIEEKLCPSIIAQV